MKAQLALSAMLAATFAVQPAFAQKKRSTTTPSLVVQPWMSKEIGDAWALGYRGQNTTIMVVDQFNGGSGIWGNLTGINESLRHGQWTLKEANLVAPSATMRSHDFSSGTRVALAAGRNVLNLSYGMMASSAYATSPIKWSAQESSIIRYANEGRAVVAKAAGNDAVAVDAANSLGNIDYLNRDLIGKQSAIFVGALSTNGTTSSPATLADYSNTAGANAMVQNQFLMVGVEGSKTGLYGTSFAAPIISGYAAIVSNKFTSATPTQIVNQLLNTARQDTISGYELSVHGKGEASITRALAPVSIN
ncbi:MAG: S8 family serine peptidase [Hydrogenophaga sp.]|jgi:subtilisin family serine protease|nr:S8 family serine peptidase [Hydrogenophaga sp.]MDP1783457.1 S8 family serine peptidase [Hydrogenophaga sp.]